MVKVLEERIKKRRMMDEQLQIQRELLELTIKAGRRLMHDFDHLLQELKPNNPVKQEFEERARMWRDIFYPDNGPKNYRAELHLTINRLNIDLQIAREKLVAHGIDPDAHKPY